MTLEQRVISSRTSSPSRAIGFLAAALLLSTSAHATTPVRISQDPLPGESVGYIQVATDGSVLYQFGPTRDRTFSVWRATDSAAPYLISGTLSQTRNVRPTYSNQLSPDGQYAYFNVALEGEPTGIDYEFFRAPIAGGEPSPVLQNPELPDSRALRFFDPFGFTPDGSELLYVSDHESPGILDFYAQPVGGGAPRRISSPRASNTSLLSTQFR